MEKYGVEIDDEKVKTGGSVKTCPKCGRALPDRQSQPDQSGNVSPPWYCPNCGTEPFEKQPKK